MMGIDGAMLDGAFGLVVAGTSATIERRLAGDLFEQRVSTIRNAATNDAQRAGFADGGADLPAGVNPHCARPAQAGGGKTADGCE
jgi:hypothetical protein